MSMLVGAAKGPMSEILYVPTLGHSTHVYTEYTLQYNLSRKQQSNPGGVIHQFAHGTLVTSRVYQVPDEWNTRLMTILITRLCCSQQR